MFLTVHAAAGAAIGVTTDNLALAFILGIASHFILDIIPHGDESIIHWGLFKSKTSKLATAAMLDGFILLAVFIYWLQNADFSLLPNILAGMFGGIAPDALWGLHELTGAPILNQYRKLHQWFHTVIQKKITLGMGLLIQIPLLIFFSLIIILS